MIWLIMIHALTIPKDYWLIKLNSELDFVIWKLCQKPLPKLKFLTNNLKSNGFHD